MLFVILCMTLVILVGYLIYLKLTLKRAQKTCEEMATELRRLDYEFGEFIYEVPNPQRR